MRFHFALFALGITIFCVYATQLAAPGGSNFNYFFDGQIPGLQQVQVTITFVIEPIVFLQRGIYFFYV
jgi:hypothetical protein